MVQLSKLDLNSGLFNNLKQYLENLEISLQVINEDIIKPVGCVFMFKISRVFQIVLKGWGIINFV